jgi:diadenylate cyclase
MEHAIIIYKNIKRGVMNLNSLRDLVSQLKWSIMNIPSIRIGDIVDILIVAYLIYKIIIWIKDTRAWALFKGVVVIFSAAVIAYVFQLNTVWWILSNTISVGIIAVFVVFQPEFRRALEQLGRGRFFSNFMIFDEQREREESISTGTIEAIIKAVEHLADSKIGALIVIERNVKLGEYERTGIKIDALVTAQLLINIFQPNTPLHDGAVIIKNNRVSAATCYLPLTDSLEISKELGTRHRAALGISEVSDAITIVVSEETGIISVTDSGSLTRNIKGEFIRTMLKDHSSKKMDRKKLVLWKGRHKNE